MGNENLPGELNQLLDSKSKTNFALARTNFEIGKMVNALMEEGGEEAVKRLAEACQEKSVSFERFLFEAARVYRCIKEPSRLHAMRAKMGRYFTWGFLLTRMAKAPEGDTEESQLFWEAKMDQIEKSLGSLEETYENLPVSIREQLDGLLSSMGGEPTAAEERTEREILSGPIPFGHIADIQMSEAFTTAGRLVIDPETGKNERLLDLQRCVNFAFDSMVEKGCRVILAPGDITETDKPTPNEQGVLRMAFEKAAKHCPIIVCPGNHDLSKNPKDACSLEFLKGRHNIHVIGKPSVLYLEGMEVNNTPSESWPQEDCMKIFVLPFPSKSIANGEAEGKSIAELNEIVSGKMKLVLESFRMQIDPRVPNALLLHLTVADADGGTNEQMLMFDPNVHPLDLRGFDYVALGHIHKFQKIGNEGLQHVLPSGNGTEDKICAYYSGSIDRMDFNEESDPKGFIVGTFKGRDADVEFIETPARVFKTLEPSFFQQPNWKEQVDPRTVYRVKGELLKEEYEALKPSLREFSPVPLLNRITVKREFKVRDVTMTEELKEEDAVKQFLVTEGRAEDIVNKCLAAHYELINELEKEENLNGTQKSLAA